MGCTLTIVANELYCDPSQPRWKKVVAEHHLLTVREVAEAMRVSTMTVYRLIKGGDLPAIRVGKHFRIRETDLSGYLDAQTVHGGGKWPAA
jgi:excisionase family DNA binding protein